jgi:hypothetical protein
MVYTVGMATVQGHVTHHLVWRPSAKRQGKGTWYGWLTWQQYSCKAYALQTCLGAGGWGLGAGGWGLGAGGWGLGAGGWGLGAGGWGLGAGEALERSDNTFKATFQKHLRLPDIDGMY